MGQNNWEGGAVPLSDGLDTRPCKILDPRLLYQHIGSCESCKLLSVVQNVLVKLFYLYVHACYTNVVYS